MPGYEELKTLLETGALVYGSDGQKIGTLGHINLDERTGLPDFITVHTGFLAGTEHFVPLNEVEISHGNLYVKFPRDFVNDAPDIDPTGALSPADEERLYRHYSQVGAGNLPTPEPPDPVRGPGNPHTVGQAAVQPLHPGPGHDSLGPPGENPERPAPERFGDTGPPGP